MSDENPILRSLLDSLTTIDKRLNLIEDALSIQPAPRIVVETAGGSRQGSVRSSSSPGHDLHQDAHVRKPLPTSAPSGAGTAATAGTAAESPGPHAFSKMSVAPSVVSTAAYPDHLGPRDTPIKEESSDTQGMPQMSDSVSSGGGGASAGAVPLPLQPSDNHSRLEALPEGFLVTGRSTLQEELDGWTIPRGYSMRINGTRSHGRRQKIRMVCFRGGRSRLRPKEEEAKREREKERRLLFPDLPPARRRKPTTDRISKKCECPFRFELVEVCPGADRYAVHYTNDDHMQHNHAAADLMLDPRARKLPRALKAEVDQWLRAAGSGAAGSPASGGTCGTGDKSAGTAAPGWTIAKIQAELQRRGYGHVLDFDLRNRKRALLHKERMALLKQQQSSSSSAAAVADSNTPAESNSSTNGNNAGEEEEEEEDDDDDDDQSGDDGEGARVDAMETDEPVRVVAAGTG